MNSHNRLSSFFLKVPGARHHWDMDLARLDKAVHQYFVLRLAPATNKAYRNAVTMFSAFCMKYNISTPFPVNQLLLCRFVMVQAEEGLSLVSIKTYLAGVCHAQIMRGLLEPRQEAGPMARLKLVQVGVLCQRVSKEGASGDKRLPITVPILGELVQAWSPPLGGAGVSDAAKDKRYDRILLRAAAGWHLSSVG